MNNFKKYKCLECFSLFADYQLKDDGLFCPLCGGHLEEGPFKQYDRTESAGSNEEKKQDSNFEREERNQTYETRKKRLHTQRKYRDTSRILNRKIL